MIAATFPALLQGFFTDRLVRQMRASPNTIAGYRDSFRLLLRYAADRLRKSPSKLTIEDPECRRAQDAKRNVLVTLSPCARRQSIVPPPSCGRSDTPLRGAPQRPQ